MPRLTGHLCEITIDPLPLVSCLQLFRRDHRCSLLHCTIAVFSSAIHYRALPLTASHSTIGNISTNSANLSIVMRQNHLYLEINEATLIRGPSAALPGQGHQYFNCLTPAFLQVFPTQPPECDPLLSQPSELLAR